MFLQRRVARKVVGKCDEVVIDDTETRGPDDYSAHRIATTIRQARIRRGDDVDL